MFRRTETSRICFSTSRSAHSLPSPNLLINIDIDDDSDDEFSTATLVAEAEAAYKPQKRGARGRRRNTDGAIPTFTDFA